MRKSVIICRFSKKKKIKKNLVGEQGRGRERETRRQREGGGGREGGEEEGEMERHIKTYL